jgi:hypothetical protein
LHLVGFLHELYYDARIHEHQSYADYVNILGERTHTIKKNTNVLVVASKDNGLQVNADKTKYMVMSCLYRLIKIPLKGWKISNIWERPQRI